MATSADYRLGEYAFPRGWFAVANASEAGRSPRTIHYFGQDTVLYRGESGRVVLLDAYCPHMGTHLGSGENSATTTSDHFMEGDNIRCPFHAWRFGADGVCNHIPYHDGPIPPQARVKSWPVEERYGVIFAWHDPEGQQPDYPVPDFPEWDTEGAVRWDGLEYLCDLNHPIEILDNMSDVAHLDHLHGSNVLSYENEVEGHILHQRQCSATEGVADLMGTSLTTLAGYVGPGIAFGRFVELQALQLICVTPIEDGTCRLWQTALVKAPPGMEPAKAQQFRDALSHQFGEGLMRDAEVWRMKRPALHVMQLPADGPFRQSRVWYSQFYNPRSKTAEIVSRVSGKHYAKGMPPFEMATA
ncbi:MAG: Rieske 2Fe-2S domain-containing protein [Novosphingobium sp.]